MHDDFDIGSEPRCEVCGTVMRTVDGGCVCGGCGYEIDIRWMSAPTAPTHSPAYTAAEPHESTLLLG